MLVPFKRAPLTETDSTHDTPLSSTASMDIYIYFIGNIYKRLNMIYIIYSGKHDYWQLLMLGHR